MLYLNTELHNCNAAQLHELLPQLPLWRRQQAMRYRHLQGQRECVLSYLELCRGLREEYGVLSPPDFEYDLHGKPSLAGFPHIFFSISHCARAVGCLLADVRKACEGLDPKEIDAPDGIHLGEKGNRIFAETVKTCLEASFERDETVLPVERNVYSEVKSGSASVISFDGNDWYTPKSGEMKFVTKDGALKISNTTGLWPDGQYVPSVPVAIDPAKGSLHVKMSTSGASASVLLFFGFATPSAYTEGKYIVINEYLGVERDGYTGDIKPAQSCDVSIPLSSLKLSEDCYTDDGLLVISGVKLFVAGAAYQPVTVEALEVVWGE